MKSNFFKLLLIGLFVFIPLSASQAASTKTGNVIYVAEDEIVGGNLYATGQSIVIDGTIGGDLIVLAQTITVNGRVEGDIIAAGQNIIINGEVGGNIRIAGDSLNINGAVSRNVNVFGSKIILGPNSRVGWDAYIAGANLEMRGTIEGGLNGQISQAIINGKIGKNLDLRLSNGDDKQELIINPGAIINGDVSYASKNPAQISNQAAVAGSILQKNIEKSENNNWLTWAWSKLFAMFSALAVGLFLIFIGRDVTSNILVQLNESPLKMFLPGLLLLFVIPPIAIILIFTLIGIPLALMLGAWWISSAYIAQIYTALFIGQVIIKKVSRLEKVSPVLALGLGVFVCWLLFAAPYIGWLMSLAASCFGLGGIWIYTINQLKKTN